MFAFTKSTNKKALLSLFEMHKMEHFTPSLALNLKKDLAHLNRAKSKPQVTTYYADKPLFNLHRFTEKYLHDLTTAPKYEAKEPEWVKSFVQKEHAIENGTKTLEFVTLPTAITQQLEIQQGLDQKLQKLGYVGPY